MNTQKVPLLICSRVCLAGRFNAKDGLTYKELDNDKKHWKRITIQENEYEMMKRNYYPSLIRSMIEINDKENQPVFRYAMELSENCDNLMNLYRNDRQNAYPCTIKRILLWFFPYDIILFSIEIEEKTNSFDDLTFMHGKWKNWSAEYEKNIKINNKTVDIGFHTQNLDSILIPLSNLTKEKKPAKLTFENTKLKQYQVIQSNCLHDDLLYEVGTFSSIGVVSITDPCKSFKPSVDYYNKIITENVISVYSNWKALALNDSFTVLTLDGKYIESEFNEYDTNGQLIETGYFYFELLYMRCLLEEYFCFDRNNLYREDVNFDSEKIENEIAYMEKVYFFDDMSYDFLPPLMYRTMAKGLGLQMDREQLTQNVKKSLRESRQERHNNVVNFVQIFAVFSTILTIRLIINDIWPCINSCISAIVSGIVALVLIIILIKWPQFFSKLFHKI